jgi:anti-sigma regulatory factor (Ser/Thr protein kinase)
MQQQFAKKRRLADVYSAPARPLVAHAKLEVSSDLGELARVREFVRHVCRELTGPALDEISTSEVQLAATEAASNIMRHACQGHSNRRIDVRGEVLDDRVSIELSHEGPRFSVPPVVDEPVVDENTEGGLGLYIMQQILDDVVYSENQSQRQSTTLIKNRQRDTATES